MWEQLLQHFQTLDQRPLERMAILVAGLLFFWIIEGAIPLVNLSYKRKKVHHAAVNFGFTVIHLVIHTLLAIIIIKVSDWCASENFGIIHWTGSGVLMGIFISILALDFSSWLVHFVMHKSRLLWRFHLVHHSDNSVDVTTGLRHHPGDSLLRGAFFIALIFLSGAPMYGVMIYQTLLVFATAFTHANIRLPKRIDAVVSYFLVSPNMHKVHHHWKQPYTDSNYGAVFSFWDRILGTFKKLDSSEIRYGLDRYYPNEKDEDFMSLIRKPFQKLDS